MPVTLGQPGEGELLPLSSKCKALLVFGLQRDHEKHVFIINSCHNGTIFFLDRCYEFGTAAVDGPELALSLREYTVSLHFPYGLRTGHTGELKGEWVGIRLPLFLTPPILE